MPSSRALPTPSPSICRRTMGAPVVPDGNACPARMAPTASSMLRSRSALSLLLLPLALAGCLGATPERARIVAARLVDDAGRPELEVTQELRFSRTMREALAHGIPLRLVYVLQGCGADSLQALSLRYVPLTRHYELQREGDTLARSFARRSALLASLDRVRLPLPSVPPPACRGVITVALDLTTLPTPLRFPAFLRRAEWRLVSPPVAWPDPSPRV